MSLNHLEKCKLFNIENNGVVITVLGGLCLSKRLPVRLVAGVWCLAAFIFVQAYSSILFTYIVTPVNLPLVNSVYDTFQHSDIRLLLRKGVTLEVLASVSLRFVDMSKDYRLINTCL